MSRIDQTQKEAEKRARDERRKLRAIFRKTFETVDGRKAIKILKDSMKFDQPAYLRENGSYDPIAAAIRDGRRSVLLDIQKFIDLPDEPEGDETKPEKKAIR